ncbi:translocon-associated protein subunit beta-like [Telopea speciosissima]|uniref:translocon-associated protein subunit beta-like n=1 Tax=Telopea speciosissima TaxID=54955 RepID=UPI001CC76F27|nr:translocon-associated protein subunit beta-like [Telopea speciosissima]
MANPAMEVALISVIVALFLVSATFGSSDAPFIVAHKKVSLNRLKSGAERVSISIDLYNQGPATAYDVSLADDSWTQNVFDMVSGNTSKSWERIDAGSLVSHSFVLESKVKTMFYGAPAIIKFRIPTKAALQEAYSTPLPPLDILADRPPEKKFEWAKMLTKYGSLVSVISMVVLFVYMIATPSKSGAVKGCKKRR